MRVLVPVLAVLALFLLVVAGVGGLGLHGLFGAAIPAAAALVFTVGVAARVIGWARSPVPFRIPTTCGQQRSLPWIRPSRVECPTTTRGVLARMALEVLCFRSLFRNTRTELHEGRLSYPSTKWLWAAGLAFHYAMLVVALRHLRFFLEPVPAAVVALTAVDGFLQAGLPPVQASTVLFLGALAFLLGRRLLSARLRYLSLPADHFALCLLLAIGLSGAWLRHVSKIDVPSAKAVVMGLLHLAPAPSEGLGVAFHAHLLFVSALAAWFPFSKLVHAPGIFLSPTRNLTTNSREVRHVNPWNPPVEVHTYAEYEDEFRERMRDAGLPVEKEA